MVDNPPKGFPQVAPYLLYEDLDAALEWLPRAFGLTASARVDGPDGHAMHAELRMGEGVVMMGQPGDDYRNPLHLGTVTSFVYAYVDDVDRHFETAKAAGVTIRRELADQYYGDRSYVAIDPEGHSWSFAQHVRDVPSDELHP